MGKDQSMADFWGISAMVPLQCTLAGAAVESTLQQVQKSRFSGAIGADQGGQAAGLKLEADLINGQLVFVSKAQLLSAEHGGRDGCWVAHDAGTANFSLDFPAETREGRSTE